MGGVSPQGYLAMCGDVLVVPCGRATPAFFDAATGKLIYHESEGLFPGGAWTMTAPGLGGGAAAASPETPLDFKLSQDLKRSREELARTERQLQDLEVEANLAGVPEHWCQPEAPEGEGGEGVAEPR